MSLIRSFLLLSVILLYISRIDAQQTHETLITYDGYLLYVPKNKPESGKYPLLLFLHGSGERGENLDLVKKNGPPSFLDEKDDFPFVVVSPQCPKGIWWNAPSLLKILDQVESRLPIDKDREYVTGLSMGGFGTWDLAQLAPDRFAAIAPVCGGGDSSRLCLIRHIPAWVFHGAKDDVVSPNQAERLVKGLQQLGADVKLTIYPDYGHNSWEPAYADPELYKWLLSHKRNEKTPMLKKSDLVKYTGKFKSATGETIILSIEAGNLFAQRGQNNKNLYMAFEDNKFRIQTDDENNSELYFIVNEKGKITGLTTGPCENTLFNLTK